MGSVKSGIYSVCVAAACGYLGGKFLKRSNKKIEVNKHHLKSKSLPKAFDGFKIAQVSDLQSQEFGLGQRDLISAVRRSRADIIVITGDLLDRNHTDFGLATEALEGLLKLAPVYYVNGNHELSVAEDEMTDYYEQMRAMGVHVLLDRAEKIFRGGETIEILGISEDSVFGAKEIGYEHGADYADAVLAKSVQILKDGYGNGKEDEVDNAAKKCFSILLTHEPQYLEQYAESGVNLVFAGHAHGGQFRLPGGQGLFSPGQGVLPKITSGFYVKDGTVMMVSRGLGNSVFPFRLNNHPEVVVVALHSSK